MLAMVSNSVEELVIVLYLYLKKSLKILYSLVCCAARCAQCTTPPCPGRVQSPDYADTCSGGAGCAGLYTALPRGRPRGGTDFPLHDRQRRVRLGCVTDLRVRVPRCSGFLSHFEYLIFFYNILIIRE